MPTRKMHRSKRAIPTLFWISEPSGSLLVTTIVSYFELSSTFLKDRRLFWPIVGIFVDHFVDFSNDHWLVLGISNDHRLFSKIIGHFRTIYGQLDRSPAFVERSLAILNDRQLFVGLAYSQPFLSGHMIFYYFKKIETMFMLLFGIGVRSNGLCFISRSISRRKSFIQRCIWYYGKRTCWKWRNDFISQPSPGSDSDHILWFGPGLEIWLRSKWEDSWVWIGLQNIEKYIIWDRAWFSGLPKVDFFYE